MPFDIPFQIIFSAVGLFIVGKLIMVLIRARLDAHGVEMRNNHHYGGGDLRIMREPRFFFVRRR